jgi:hypothetical protein
VSRKAASYGQAGKLLNVALKVYVYYCRLPSPQAAQKLLPFLHGAVDTLMMEHLKKSFPQVHVPATTIEAVDKVQYFTLQAMIKRDIESEFGASILPVQWDDIMWCRLNRTDPYFHPS